MKHKTTHGSAAEAVVAAGVAVIAVAVVVIEAAVVAAAVAVAAAPRVRQLPLWPHQVWQTMR